MNDIILYGLFIILSGVVINLIMKYSKLLNNQEFLEASIDHLRDKVRKIENDIYEAYKRLPPLDK
jgi:hypothetical protein